MVQVTNTPRFGEPSPSKSTVEIDKASDIVAIGGGCYELPGGRRVRGKKAALEALA